MLIEIQPVKVSKTGRDCGAEQSAGLDGLRNEVV